MPPRGVKSAKRERQYEHIKESELDQGRSTKRAKQIAAATVNKQRAEAGETRGSRKGSGKKNSSSASRGRTSSSKSKKTSSRKKTGGRKSTRSSGGSSRKSPSKRSSKKR